MKTVKLISLLLLFAGSSIGWGVDNLVDFIFLTGKPSIAAKANATLYATLPSNSGTGYSMIVLRSTDNGLTWAGVPYVGVPAGANITKTKMVRTVNDSIYCTYLQGNAIFMMNVETGIVNEFTNNTATDFDVAASSVHNAIYMFIQEVAGNSIRRYGTTDGGYTWGGNTALVASTGRSPKVCTGGNRLYLNYRGPILADTAKSIIRGAFYNETAAGTITPGTFQDLVTDVTFDKPEFFSAAIGNTVWFIYNENNAQHNVHLRVSTDGGLNYDPDQVIAGSSGVDRNGLSAAPYLGAGDGIDLLLFADSLGANPTPQSSRLELWQATLSNPTSFTGQSGINDYLVEPLAFSYPPMLVSMPGSYNNRGVAYLPSVATQAVFYDVFNPLTNIKELTNTASVHICPNPAVFSFSVVMDKSWKGEKTITVHTVGGLEVLRAVTSSDQLRFDNHQLSTGIYWVSVATTHGVYNRKLVVQ